MIREEFMIISKNVMKQDIKQLKEKIFKLEKRIDILESKEKKSKKNDEIDEILQMTLFDLNNYIY